MANTIRIKRRTTDSTAPSTSQAVNAELAFNENTETLYYGKGGNTAASSSVIKIGGNGAFLTVDTNQTPTGVKTFSPSTIKVTGGTNNQVLSATATDGVVAWTTIAANAYGTISDTVNTATASGGDTLKFRTSGPLTALVTSNDATHGDNLLLTVGTMGVANGGTGFTTYNTGDLLYASAANTLSKLAKGTPGSSLVIRGLVPVWDTPTSAELIANLGYTPANNAGGTMTGLLTLHANPTNAKHAATKEYVDDATAAAAQGLDVKASCRVATPVVNIALSTGTALIIDGVQTVVGDRVLVKDQTTPTENGIYVVAAGAWSRAADADTSAEVTTGMFTFISEGAVYADSGWVLTTNDAITLGSTALTFEQFSGAGQITAGYGLTKSGNTLNVVTANAARIVVNPDSIDLAIVSPLQGEGIAGINFVQSVTVDSYGRVSETLFTNVRSATTSVTGITSLTDSTSSTSTSTAATPASVKLAYDLAGLALPKAGGTMTGKVITGAGGASYASLLLGVSSVDPTSKTDGDLWNVSGAIRFWNGSATKIVAFSDSNITGTAANVSGTVAVANGGTGATDTGTARTNLGLAIGTHVQAYNAALAAIAVGTYTGASSITTLGTITTGTWTGTAIAVANGGTGAATTLLARSNLGLAIGSDVQAYHATLAAIAGGTYTGASSITTVGTITTGTWTGTAIAVANGGTGATDTGTARTNLGLAIGTHVQAYNANLAAVATDTYTLDGGSF